MPRRRTLPGLELRAKARVTDPLTMGIRVNGPDDGWLGDPSNYGQYGDYSSGSQVPLTTFWVGSDTGGFAGGPIGWNNLPWMSPGWGLLPPPPPTKSRSYVLSSVERALAVLRNPILSTPWTLTKASGEREQLPLWVTDPMLTGRVTGPNGPVHGAAKRLGATNFWSSFLTHAILWGRAAFVYQETPGYVPIAGSLRMLNPFLVGEVAGNWVIDPAGDDPVYTDTDGRFTMPGSRVGWRIMVMRGLPPNDGQFPEGVLLRHFETLRLGAAVTEYVYSTFGSGVPSGFLKTSAPNVTQAEIDRLKNRWMDAHGSGKRSVAVLNATTDYTPISIKPSDAQAQEQTHVADKMVAHCFGLDSVWTGEGASGMTYNNTTDRRKDLIDISVKPWGEAFSDVLTSMLPFGTRFHIEWNRFSSRDLSELLTTLPHLIQGIESGFLSLEEARQIAGLLPGPETYTPTTPEGTP